MRLSLRRSVVGIDRLESRTLFHLELTSALPNVAVAPGTSQSEIALSDHLHNELVTGTIVRFTTDFGNVDLELYDKGAPATVANFLGYVNRGDYNNTYFHRAITNSIVQGGGYGVSTVNSPVHIPTQPPIANEFSGTRSNRRGTIGMARNADAPDSATSEFYFNVGDNSGSFDTDGGGFTVFGKIVNNTLLVVDTIDGLQKYQFPDVPFQDPMPLTGAPPITADNVVKLQTAAVVPEAALYNYTVQSSDPVLVTPVVDDGVLRLLYGAGQTGTATITITATDIDGTTITDTFEAGVGELNVQIGNGGAKQATFTDADGTAATISLKGGSGTIRVKGSNLSQTVGKSGAVVQGTITEISGIDMTGTGTSGALTIKASGGDGVITVGRLTSDGGMKSIAGKQMSITGDVTFAGNVAKADFADITNSTMLFGGAGGGLSMSLRNAQGVEIVSLIPIKTFKAESFSGGGPEDGTLSAPSLSSLTINGDFTQRLNIDGALGTVKIGGAVGTFLPWTIGGSAGKLTVGSFSEGFIADFLGPVSSLTVGGNFTGDISAAAIKSLSVKGEMTGANLILTGSGAALGKATISGSITNSRIQATSGIGTVTAAAINASTVYAGVNTDGGILPSTAEDFAAGESSIKSITLKGVGGAPSFANSNIAARSVGKLSLGVIQAGNAGVPFGVAGDTIASLAGTGDTVIKLSKLADPAQSTKQQDFEVRLF